MLQLRQWSSLPSQSGPITSAPSCGGPVLTHWLQPVYQQSPHTRRVTGGLRVAQAVCAQNASNGERQHPVCQLLDYWSHHGLPTPWCIFWSHKKAGRSLSGRRRRCHQPGPERTPLGVLWSARDCPLFLPIWANCSL